MKELILETVSDLVGDFLFYDRKEDEYLGVGEIQKAVERGDITKDEIVDEFRKQLDAWW